MFLRTVAVDPSSGNTLFWKLIIILSVIVDKPSVSVVWTMTVQIANVSEVCHCEYVMLQ